MWTYNYTTELKHYGIAGMKWGKRNGPPYPLSAKAHSASERAAGTSGWTKEAKKEARKARLDRAFNQSEKNGKDKPNVSPAEKIVKNTSDALNAVDRLHQYTKKKKPDTRKEQLAKMSDDELRRRINRLDMEKRYLSLTEDEVDLGKDYFDKAVDIANNVATLALAAGGIAAMIRKIKG